MFLNNKKILAIIPAREGSKRLPKKNILPLDGKPLISWTIEEAIQSKYIDNVIVSSDDKEILNIAKNYSIKYMNRDKSLSSDTATSFDVVLNVINQQNEQYDYVMLLQPTSPLRTVKDIDNACDLLVKKNALSIVSMCETEHPIQWCTKLTKDNCLDHFTETINTQRSQEQEVHYRLNGAIYLIKIDEFIRQKSFLSNIKSYAYIMDKQNSIDIDDQFDFNLAEYIKKRENENKNNC